MSTQATKRVVVVGGGFGGLQAVQALGRSSGLNVTLIDRHNYHLFQPLTYQVATGSLSPGEIAVPLRQIVGRDSDVQILLGEVSSFDLERRELTLAPTVPEAAEIKVPYDALIVAGGSSYAYFGHDEWRSVALEVKSLDSALRVRGRILEAFEAAELNPDEQATWLTFVVVGGGPTGVEISGQIAELANDTLPGEFRNIDPRSGRVLLVELGDRVLREFPPTLSARATRALVGLGVTPMLSHEVIDVQHDSVTVKASDGVTSQIPTRTVVWAAGVEASPLAKALAEAIGAEVDRAGRLTVEPDLTLPGHPEVVALGDMVRVRDAHTGQVRTLPGVAPVAMQQGRYAGRLVSERLAGRPSTRPFHYHDKGTLATIGRAQAVAAIGPFRFGGFLAWITWLIVHIFYLVGFENRLTVVINWAYSFLTHGRGDRLITEAAAAPAAPSGAAEPTPPEVSTSAEGRESGAPVLTPGSPSR
jgi:NADH dehydrogenase